MLFALVALGYLIEGVRILGNNMPIGEKTWAPIGWFIANIFQSFNMSDSSLSLTYRVMWFVHMVNTMAFVASIGHSKFFHMFGLPFASLVTPARRGAVLNPMDFEDESAETFGLGKLGELTQKNKMDYINCVECGRCTDVCPATAAGKNLDPKTIITKGRDFMELNPAVDADFWENPIYASNELDACTTCGACMEECPAHIEHVSYIMELKRYKTLTLGDIPPAAADAVNKIKNTDKSFPVGINQKQDDNQVVQDIVGSFINAFKNKDMQGLLKVSQLTSQQQSLYTSIFKLYQSLDIKVTPNSFSVSKKTGIAGIKIEIIDLVDSKGNSVVTSADWTKIEIKIVEKNDNWLKAVII